MPSALSHLIQTPDASPISSHLWRLGAGAVGFAQFYLILEYSLASASLLSSRDAVFQTSGPRCRTTPDQSVIGKVPFRTVFVGQEASRPSQAVYYRFQQNRLSQTPPKRVALFRQS